MILKVSVLASGTVLLDGQPVAFDELQKAFDAASREKGMVWYYREAAAQSPPEHAIRVLNMVVQNKLRISLSSKPDFSDYVDGKGVSHPRTETAQQPRPASANGTARMPEIDLRNDIEEVFAGVKKAAIGNRRRSALVILRPDRRSLVLPAVSETADLKHAALSLQRLVPSTSQRRIAVIAYTVFPSAEPNAAEVNRSIPFAGMLMGLTYIGHAVWVFEGHASAMKAGCRDADVLIVDSAMLPLLPEGWMETASAVMRNSNILVHDRSNFQIRILRKVGEKQGELAFAN